MESKKYETLLAVLAILVVVGGISTGVLWSKLNKKQVASVAGSDSNLSANDLAVQEVAKVFEPAQSEAPTLLTVNGLDELKGQPFFNRAEVGDLVLVYVKAGKAVLWRPSLNKIIEVAPIELPQATSTAAVN